MTAESGIGATRLPASIEATPKQAATAEGLKGLLPAGTRVYLTDLGTDTDETLVAAAVRMRDLGYEPVPHIAVRRLAGETQIAARLARLTGEAGVADVLVIAGGADTPAGPYAATIDFLQSGLLGRFGITRIGVAGHPEGSPDIAPEAIVEALRAKVAWGEQNGATLRIVTQFGFDAAGAVRWLESLAAAGYGLPVHLGVAGPAKIATLIKYAAMCGVGPSLAFLRKRARLLTALTTTHSPDAFVEPVERWHADFANSPLAGIHVFPFGGLGQAARWLSERGSFDRLDDTEMPAASRGIGK